MRFRHPLTAIIVPAICLTVLLAGQLAYAANCCLVNQDGTPIAQTVKDSAECTKLGGAFTTSTFVPDAEPSEDKTECIASPSGLGESTPTISNPLDNPELSVQIPGLALRESTCDADGCSTPWLADYIEGLYKYGIGAIAVFAVIGLMIGGLLWTSSAGNQERVGDARKWIGGSLMGVLISLTSYTVLTIINPALIELSPIKVTYIKQIELEALDPIEAQTISTGANGNIGFSNGQYKVPWILQNSAEIGSYSYGYGTDIAHAGCGITALTMVLNFFGVNVTVPQMADKMLDNGGRKQGKGTNNYAVEKVLKEYGLKTERAGSFDGAVSLLSKGPVIMSVWDNKPETRGDKTCPFTDMKHYIVLTGYQNGMISINDPANKGRSQERTQISLADLKSKCTFGSGAIVSYK